MRRFSLKSGAVLFLAVASALLIALAWLPRLGSGWARKRLEASLREGCPRCVFSLEKLSISLLDGRLVASGMSFKSSPTDPTQVQFSVKRIEARGGLWRGLLGAPVRLTELRILEPSVKVIEDDQNARPKQPGAKPPANGEWLRGLPELEVAAVEVDAGRFSYLHLATHASPPAVIDIREIDLKTTAIGTRPELASRRFIDADLSAKVEGTGKLALSVRMDPFTPANRDRIVVNLRNQDLRGFSRFFRKEEGIELEGFLEQGMAVVDISQGKLTGTLSLRYRGLDLEYFNTDERAGIATFLSDAGEELIVEPAQRATVSIGATREPNQSVIKFILSGLVEGAQKVLKD